MQCVHYKGRYRCPMPVLCLYTNIRTIHVAMNSVMHCVLFAWHGGMCLVGNIPVQAVAVMHRYTVYNVYTIYATNTAWYAWRGLSPVGWSDIALKRFSKTDTMLPIRYICMRLNPTNLRIWRRAWAAKFFSNIFQIPSFYIKEHLTKNKILNKILYDFWLAPKMVKLVLIIKKNRF